MPFPAYSPPLLAIPRRLGPVRCRDCGHPADTVRFTAAGNRPRPVCTTCAKDMDRERALFRGVPFANLSAIHGHRGSI